MTRQGCGYGLDAMMPRYDMDMTGTLHGHGKAWVLHRKSEASHTIRHDTLPNFEVFVHHRSNQDEDEYDDDEINRKEFQKKGSSHAQVTSIGDRSDVSLL